MCRLRHAPAHPYHDPYAPRLSGRAEELALRLRSDEGRPLSSGTVYPLLARLTEDGWLDAVGGIRASGEAAASIVSPHRQPVGLRRAMLWNARMRRGSAPRSGRRDRAATLYPLARPNRRGGSRTLPAAPSRLGASDGVGTRLYCRSRRADALRGRGHRCDRSPGAKRLHPTDHNFCKNGGHHALSTQEAPSIRQIVLFRMVGIALLPALGVSIMHTQVVGGMLGGSESVVDRVSQIVLPATFFGACYYIRARHPPTTRCERP